MDFYEELADEYGEVTDQARRTAAAHAFADRVTAMWHPQSVLDVACGTGLFALEFARRGMQVVGADLSEAMLAKARAAAAAEGLPAEWIRTPMQEVAERLQGRQFDLILCMGNSIPHLPDAAQLLATARAFHSRLAPGGHAFLHLINYQKILAENDRIVGISRQDATREYVRFYDLGEDLIRFNVLRIRWEGERASHDLVTTTLRPFRPQDIDKALQTAGFQRVEAVAGFDFSPFDAAHSDVLLAVATR